ncbi:hypothetical protein KJ866_00600 [Patescibacteria group bacterium]|nr:hypothetical protein [Patescibacteria group bacterium]
MRWQRSKGLIWRLKKGGTIMHYVTEKEADIERSLDQHCRELEVLKKKIKRPDLPPDKKTRLISRIPVVREKITQLCSHLQAAG